MCACACACMLINLVTVLLEYLLQILKLCDRLNSEDAAKILVIGSWHVLKNLTIDGNKVDYYQAVKYYSDQGLYFFVELGRYVVYSQ